jgi:hypothetical protein
MYFSTTTATFYAWQQFLRKAFMGRCALAGAKPPIAEKTTSIQILP